MRCGSSRGANALANPANHLPKLVRARLATRRHSSLGRDHEPGIRDLGSRTLPAILAGGVANFALGALWYTVLFQKQWMAAIGRTAQDFGDAKASPSMLFTFVGCFVTIAALAVVYQWGGGASVLHGLWVGALLGVGVAAMETLKASVYNVDERVDPRSLFVVNASYAVLGLMLSGIVYALIA